MKRIKITLSLLFISSILSLFLACTPSVELPNVLRGHWGLRIDGADKDTYMLNEDFTYSHKVTKEGNIIVEYKGTYSFKYNNFDITSANGVITFSGANEAETETEYNSYSFKWTASADRGPIDLTLSCKDTKGYMIDTKYMYYGGSN